MGSGTVDLVRMSIQLNRGAIKRLDVRATKAQTSRSTIIRQMIDLGLDTADTNDRRQELLTQLQASA